MNMGGGGGGGVKRWMTDISSTYEVMLLFFS